MKNQVGVPFILGTSIFGDKDNFQSAIQIEEVKFSKVKIIYCDGVKIEQIKNILTEILGKLKNSIKLGALTAKDFGFAAGKTLLEKNFPAKNIVVDSDTFIVDADFSFNSSLIV